ncbi:MAG: triosephosphate isomerase [Methanobacteriota archaeon]|jgi:triosephosphate isomerase|uniref:Triosephosphate isomerase n=1 Tax=Halorutilus salinus TaxID=2487751 RepID=A0A9Q4C6D8_9EURY|nr:triose-phosphate isomerase [Halorutilus salinus]MCX2819932.1 triose-phosphate isomerase [Halorutilus salinus]
MFLLVNLKTYEAGTGDAAVRVAEAARDVADETGVRVAVAPQAVDLRAVAETGVETFAQGVDGIGYGSSTGAIHPGAIARAGATGTLLNHSERRLRLAGIDDALNAARDVSLETVVCANNPAQSAAVAALEPDAVAVEPPELIGTGTPVSKADPDIITDTVDRVSEVSDTPVLCGAGITSGDDVESALELGAEGVLVASGVVKSESPRDAMLDLVT